MNIRKKKEFLKIKNSVTFNVIAGLIPGTGEQTDVPGPNV